MITDAPTHLLSVLECERRIVNAWPAPSTLLIGDWVVRFAHGYSGRANSASPLKPEAELDDHALDMIEGFYDAEGLPPCVRLTPLASAATRERILARGYRLKDASFGLIATLGDDQAAEPGLRIEPRASRDWIAGVSSHQIGPKRNETHLAAIVEKVRLPAAFATILADGKPVAYGMSVAERGMAEIGSIVVDDSRRGQGLGRRMVTGLMAWAKQMGCESAYLQVDQKNTVAIGLYTSLGFRRLYAYETRILD